MASSATAPKSEQDVTRPRWVSAIRERVVRLPAGLTVWRVAIGVVGFIIVAGGLVLLPLPGPGWLIIFLGIGVWATEFAWAGRLLRWVQRFARQWSAKIAAMPAWGKALSALLVVVVVGALVFAAWWFYVR